MTVCGLKLTHDGAIALIEDSRLVFCYESEKLGNSHRHSDLTLTLNEIRALLGKYGHSVSSIDRFVIDGWGEKENALPAREAGRQFVVTSHLTGVPTNTLVAGYGHLITSEDILAESEWSLEGTELSYASFMHVAGHVFSAYCTSPFAESESGAFILAWDGSMGPQLFQYDAKARVVTNRGILFPLLGCLYAQYCHAFEPFSKEPLSLAIAGKAMAYVALGSIVPGIRRDLHGILERIRRDIVGLEMSPVLLAVITKRFIGLAKEYSVRRNVDPADMITNFHYFIEDLLVSGVRRCVAESGVSYRNLCVAGGCGLNIKWNSALRQCGTFDHVWVPPFPNDSGSAIGAACCYLVKRNQEHALNWSVFAGPSLGEGGASTPLWPRVECNLQELARRLCKSSEPVVYLHGKAEIGPRALGHRSILASPCDIQTKDRLNDMKVREHYRPVAPICLEEDAPEVFCPGTPDPYMLFEHRVRDAWKDRVRAVCHIDGTARLQTVTHDSDPAMYELLKAFKALTGIPVLCNTSANHRGRGFFPDLHSAMAWGKALYVWCDGYLYTRPSAELGDSLYGGPDRQIVQ